jgi:hypothetical protein
VSARGEKGSKNGAVRRLDGAAGRDLSGAVKRDEQLELPPAANDIQKQAAKSWIQTARESLKKAKGDK